MKKIKVLYYIHGTYVNGGAFLSAFEILKRLSNDDNFEILVVLVDSAKTEVIEAIASSGLRYEIVSKWNFTIFGRFLIGYLSFNLVRLSFNISRDILLSVITRGYFQKVLEKFEPDIIHFNSSVLLPLCFHLSSDDTKSIIHCREGFRPFPLTKLRYKLLNLFQSSVDRFICISEVEKMQLDSILGHSNKTVVISNPVCNETSSTVSEKKCMAKSVAFFGGYNDNKGCKEFLIAVSNVKIPVNIFFCGPEGKDRAHINEIEELISKVEKNKYCRFNRMGLVNDPLSVISRSDLVVVPHKKPHFSRVIIESWSLQKPVIAYRDLFTETLDSRSNNALVLVDNYSIEGLTSAIEEVLNSPDLADAKATKGKKYWENNHMPEAVFKQVVSVYEELMKGRRIISEQ